MRETFKDLTFDCPAANALAADAAFWKLYDSSFPSNEREPRSVILESLRNRVGVVIRARVGGRTVGLAATHLLHSPGIPFLVYLAVSAELRSRHIGSALFEKAWTTSMERYPERGLRAAGMVWEVDIPERATSEADLQHSRRRIAFFSRLGGHILPGRYLQPPVDGVASVPMHLMFRPAPGRPLPDNTERSALVRALYLQKYHEANRISRTVLEDLLRETGTDR